MKKSILFLFSTTISTLLILASLELTVRLLYPEINHQDTQLSLFQDNSFGKSVGWKPNAEGESFGEEVHIDNFGFRTMNSPVDFSSSWLILGDSVTFGVGVKTEETFAQLVQNQLPRTKVWNTSVVGYSIPNYMDVLTYFLQQRSDIECVLLFLCLNDIYGNLSVHPRHATLKDKTLSLLKRKSKLYMLLKNSFTDRSKSYAIHDIDLYSERSEALHTSVAQLYEMNDTLKRKGIDFLVIILPYEYQLRINNKKLREPQHILCELLAKRQIATLDAYNYFISKNENSKKFYLYSDAMHLSPYGHEVVFEMIREDLL